MVGWETGWPVGSERKQFTVVDQLITGPVSHFLYGLFPLTNPYVRYQLHVLVPRGSPGLRLSSQLFLHSFVFASYADFHFYTTKPTTTGMEVSSKALPSFSYSSLTVTGLLSLDKYFFFLEFTRLESIPNFCEAGQN